MERLLYCWARQWLIAIDAWKILKIFWKKVKEDSKCLLDESAFAYKPMAEIVKAIGPTVEIISVMKPVFNYKAAE